MSELDEQVVNDVADLPSHGTASDPLSVGDVRIPDGLEDLAGTPDESSADETHSYFGSISGPAFPVPPEFAAHALRLQGLLGRPVWLLVQAFHDGSPWAHLDEPIRRGFLLARHELKKCEGIALLIDSPGGSAAVAYQISAMLRRHSGGFQAVVPRYAKSAATLLALGATDLFLGSDAELGPLDAQLMDPDREAWGSALDEIQSLERLNAAAMEQFDQVMFMLLERTGKKIDTLMPLALKFATDMMRPLLERIDTVHYTQQSRVLKVAEDYATRMLQGRYDGTRAQIIARRLVNSYPEHGFVIDRDEAATFLELGTAPEEVQACIDSLEEILIINPFNAIGHIIEGPAT